MVMSGSSMATYFMVSLILLISAFIIGITVSDQQQQQQQQTHPFVSSSSTFNIFKKEEASSEQQFQNIIEALMATQDYSNWAEVLSITDPFTFPITATFLIPGDNPLINTSTSSSSSSSSSSQSLTSTIGYHIIPQQLPFSVLQTFAIGSRIPTILPEKTILVTNNSQSNYTIDEIQITYPDLYINGAVVVHGIKSTLNYTAFGAANAKDDDHDPFSDNDNDNKKKNETSTAAEGNGGKGGEGVSSDGTKKRVFLGISWIMIYTLLIWILSNCIAFKCFCL
ncbi:hypothetical protein MKW98_001800 [Papaver atlanticum]|uniref:FAS1 domain-containing protein n=1 Tax=Papaver atlanticum TaxID=357466 RepID=A0AAD4X650_9MAGN|nr:hypothetical protein MKW98_019848 [Papaver atlanticum]KAI3878385.1 hypothetical protein MKW98_001800 [Papaver atlanticum]